jgi:hypothetical protein
MDNHPLILRFRKIAAHPLSRLYLAIVAALAGVFSIVQANTVNKGLFIQLQLAAKEHPNKVSFGAGILVFAIAPSLIKGLFLVGLFLKRLSVPPSKS